MDNILDFPLLIFTLSFITLWLSVLIGASFRKRLRPLEKDQLALFGVIQSGTLTLLSLIIGFTFSMAVSRYDLRKNYEEEEANAIGTEYVRIDLLPAADAAHVRELMRTYLDQRVLFYTTRDPRQLRQIDTYTAQLQNELWSTVLQARSQAQPALLAALAVSGMNDVLNTQGYAQAASWNRIPIGAWVLLAAIAIGCNLLVGYGAQRTSGLLFMVLPLAASVSFFLIADIDSPRRGVIRVQPQNLISLSQTLRAY